MDVSTSLARVWAVKDKDELAAMETAAQLSALAFNQLIDEILDLVDTESIKTHEALSEGIESCIQDKKELEKLISKDSKKKKPLLVRPEETDLELVDTCYPAIIQSPSSKYNLKPSASSDKNPLKPGVIVCTLGVRYRNYCSNVGRTLLIEPTADQERNYNHLYQAFEVAVATLVPGWSRLRVPLFLNSGLQ